jgi:LacI family transcriptional regulator
MTVSRVMNDDSKVRASTKAKVRASIERLGYSPNVAARNLVGGRQLRICLFYSNPSDAYLNQLLTGALAACTKAGASLIVEQLAPSTDIAQLAEHFGRDWDAAIIPPPLSDSAVLRKLITKHAFPAVFIAGALQSADHHIVRVDDFQASLELTRFLLAKGHQRIGFIKGHPDQSASAQRLKGYLAALSEAGLTQDEALIVQGYFSYRSGMEAADQLLTLEHLPSAIFAANDDMAAGVLASAARHGLTVPNDLSVAGFDDSLIATTVWPNLMTVRQPVAEMVALAITRLKSDLQNPDASTTKLSEIVAHTLIPRDSVQARDSHDF